MTSASQPPAQRDGGLQSVERAVDALELIAARGTVRVSEVAQAVGIHKSSASRLLAVLHQRNLVEPNGPRGSYRIGAGILRIAAGVGRSWDLTDVGAATCAALAAELGETVNIAVRRDDVVVNVHQASGGATVSADNWVGRPTPLHATSSGKVLLAFDPSATVPTEPVAHTAATLSGADLAIALEQVRATGFATTTDEYEIGLAAVAAPIVRRDGSLVAALSVSGPVTRLGPDRLREIAPRVRQAADEIAAALGH